MRRKPIKTVAIALVLIHVTWGATRLPGRVVGRRLDDVRAYREEGAARYLLQSSGMRGEDAIEWVLENTPPDSVVLWRGSKLGPLEFAPTLLAPRLVVHVSRGRGRPERYAGAPLARATLDGREGIVTLVGDRDSIGLEVR